MRDRHGAEQDRRRHAGRCALVIATGNAAEALGMPIVTGNPIAEAEGDPITQGVLLVNPASSKGTINYNIDGNPLRGPARHVAKARSES